MAYIKGKKVLLQFLMDDQYVSFLCATDCSLNIVTETVSVLTINDGEWEKKRGKGLSYTVSLSGLIELQENQPVTFWLINYQIQMIPVDFRMFFDDVATGLMKVVEGRVLIASSVINGVPTGFANSAFEMEGDGGLSIRDSLVLCEAYIGSASLADAPVGEGYAIIATGVVGATRIDYTINGSERLSYFGASENNIINIGDLAPGDYEIVLYPICENGHDGTPYTVNAVIEEGGGVEECAMVTGLTVGSITETTAVATFTEPVPPPADGYAWQLLEGPTLVNSGTVFGNEINLSALESGHTYLIKVKSLCEAGVSESGFATYEFTTTATDGIIEWSFVEIDAVGFFRVQKEGVDIVSVSSTDDGSFANDELELLLYVTSSGGSTVTRTLVVTDETTSTVVINKSQTTNINAEPFVPVAGHNYTIIASVGTL